MLAYRSLVLVASVGVLAGCATAQLAQAPKAAATRWLPYTMQQQADGTQLWKPIGEPTTDEACRALVRTRADRGPIAPVGLIGWYRVPDAERLWVGCLPEGYNPYEPR